MANILVFTTDLPFFPGKNGHDFFNIRYLAQHHNVGVVGPHHDHYPSAGMANLEKLLSGSYFWPRPARAVALPPQREATGSMAGWLKKLPRKWRKRWLRRLLGIAHQPADAYAQLATLANSAPQLLQALSDRRWHAMVLIQSNTEPWLDYLPALPAKFVYFHDVRCDYLRRQPHATLSEWQLRAIQAQERRCFERADLVGFVSDLDQQRAVNLLHPTCAIGVAQIPVDTDYYTRAPASWRKDGRRIALFTGHLGHPPNVDAITHFLEYVWPRVREQCPDAVFQAVGLLPDPKLREACAAAPGAELHPNVPDIRPFFWNASVYVVPMRYGGGVRQKIFEAWSMEVPVVCTTMAAEGTLAAHAENCWLEDEPAGFAARLVEQLREPDWRLTGAAKRTVLEHNSIPAGSSRYEQLVERAIHIKTKRPFKLLFDLRWMKPGKAGGVEQMSYELVSAIAQIDRRNEYRVLCPRGTYYEWDWPAGFRCRGDFTDNIDLKFEALRTVLANGLATSIGRQHVLTPAMRALRRYHRWDFDLVHSTLGTSSPELRNFPNILTVHDLQHVHHPEFFGREAWNEREAQYRDSVRQASHIICVSEFTRTDLQRSYGVPPEKLTTIWNIPSRAAWLKLDERTRRGLLARMGVRSRYLFYPAHDWPHKNHRRLIEAFCLALPELPPDVELVLAGRSFAESHPARQLILAERLESRVRHVGFRSPIEMQALYRGAIAMVFPSLFEGFGMPVAEAMIADCPVACSDVTSLPEIAGEAALYFDPGDVKAMARTLIDLTTNERRRKELVEAGRQRRLQFSARKRALETLSIYRRVFEEV